MAKKRQFKGAKYENGILSYNYLGGKGGKGGGDVSIKQQGDDWYFVGKDGEIRTDVGNGGKLTPTHMKNLKNDGIFDAVPKVELAESNYELPGEMSAPVSKAQKAFTPGDPAAGSSNPITASTENAPPTLQSGWGGETARFNKKMIGSGYSENTQYIPDTVSLPNSQSSSYGGSEFEAKHGAGSAPWNNSGQDTFASQKSLPRGTGGFESVDGVQELAGQNEFTGFGQDRMSGPSYANEYTAMGQTSDPLVWHTQDPLTDYIAEEFPDTNLEIPAKGKSSMVVQESATPGIKDQKDDSPWGTAAGWDAAGSVMKGVGGLASAYTGMKNYQLARDAHNTQKNQWQANYDQRLTAYKDNKVIANNEIAARNRTLAARGQAKSYNTI